VKEKCTRERKNNEREKKKDKDKRPISCESLTTDKKNWTAKNNSTFWLGTNLGDPKRSISVRFMGTLK
jgi:hypothetical protein